MLEEQQLVADRRPPRGRPRAASGGPTRRGRRRVPASARRSGRGLPPAVRPWADDSRGGPGSGLAGTPYPARATGPRAMVRGRDAPRMRSRGRAALPHAVLAVDTRRVTVRNRIVSSGHDTVMAVDGRVLDRLVAYQEARARGGVGLIVIQVAGVHADGALHVGGVLQARNDDVRSRASRASPRRCTPAATAVVGAAVPRRPRDHGPAGRHAARRVAPSAVPNERFHVMPRALDVARMIEEIVAGYGDAAARLRRAGLDGVEVVASHGYLPGAVPQPAHQPARRRLWRRCRATPALPARGAAAARSGAACPGFVVGLRDLDRRR